MEWQSIESAPMGQWVMVRGKARSSFQPPVDVARGERQERQHWETVDDVTKKLVKYHVVVWWSGIHCLDMEPTQWAEMPE